MDETTWFEPLTEAAKQALLREVPLIEAALLRIQGACDVSVTECGCCHIKKKNFWRDAQLEDTLRSLRVKVRRFEEEAGGRKKL